MTDSDKHSSLLQYGIDYSHKSFMVQAKSNFSLKLKDFLCQHFHKIKGENGQAGI
jgi:hypothetical protein